MSRGLVVAGGLLCLAMALGCSFGPSADASGYVRPTVFVPTAEPTPTPTPVPEPTATPSLDLEQGATCDARLKHVLLRMPGPWGAHDVWDSALAQVADCVSPLWQPVLDERASRLESILTVPVEPTLQDAQGRTGSGYVRLTFDPDYPPGDGYLHWYYDAEGGRWLSGYTMDGSQAAVAVVADLAPGLVSQLRADCWSTLRQRLLERSAHEALTPSLVSDMVRRQQRGWGCQPDLWAPGGDGRRAPAHLSRRGLAGAAFGRRGPGRRRQLPRGLAHAQLRSRPLGLLVFRVRFREP